MRSNQQHRNDMENIVRKPKKEKGFTLIEVLFAIAILAFGLLAISSMQGAAIRGNLMAIDRTEAVTWAQNQMESLMALPYNDVVSGGPIFQGIYEIKWTVFPNDPITDCKRIEVTVRYQERGIQRRDVVLTCIKSMV